VIAAADQIINQKIAEVIVLGTEDEISKSATDAGVAERQFSVIDPAGSELLEPYAEILCEIRKKKNLQMDKAREYMKNRIFFGAMMAREGEVDGMVAGSIAATANMLRASFVVIGTEEGISTASSSFVMDLEEAAPNGEEVLLYADCAVNPDPDAEQLVDIALATAKTYRALIGKQPKVAFLAFSTAGSAQHEALDKVRAATEKAKAKVAASGVDILIDGEMQADSAIVPQVAGKKCPNSPVGGQANVLIFPDLNAGNICYKLTERLAGAGAYGPVLQGLARPVNDLSRGCSADDIVGVAAITVCQAIG